MKASNWVAGFGALALVCSFGCSDDGGGDSGSGGGASGGAGGTSSGTGGSGGCDPTGQGGNTCPEYTNCAETKCSAQYQECFGAGYKSGNFAGAKCQTFMECVSTCNCDSSCTSGCYANAGSECTSCLQTTVGGCVTSSCSAELQKCAGTGGATGTGGTGTTGGTCTDLEACCASLSGTDQTNCTQTYNAVKGAGDAACGAALNTYKASGKC